MVVVPTRRFSDVFVHVTAQVDLTKVAEAENRGVRLPASPPPRGALDDEELFIVEGSKNWRSTPGQLEEREK